MEEQIEGYTDLHRAADGLLEFYIGNEHHSINGQKKIFNEIFDKNNLDRFSSRSLKDSFDLPDKEKSKLFKGAFELLENDSFFFSNDNSYNGSFKIKVEGRLFYKNGGYLSKQRKENELEKERVEKEERAKRLEETSIKVNEAAEKSMKVSVLSARVSGAIGGLTLIALGVQIYIQNKPSNVIIQEIPKIEIEKPETKTHVSVDSLRETSRLPNSDTGSSKPVLVTQGH